MSNWTITLDSVSTTIHPYGTWVVVQDSAMPTPYAVPSSEGTATLPNMSAGDTVTFNFDSDRYGLTFSQGNSLLAAASFNDGATSMVSGALRSETQYTVSVIPSTATVTIYLEANAILRGGVGDPGTIKGSLNVNGN